MTIYLTMGLVYLILSRIREHFWPTESEKRINAKMAALGHAPVIDFLAGLLAGLMTIVCWPYAFGYDTLEMLGIIK